MSTYAGNSYQKGHFVSGIPLDLVMQVAGAKQAKYDKAQANLQSELDRLSNYQIIKDSDKEVIGGKMNQLVDRMNKFSGQDLSDSRVYNQLLGETSSFYNDKDVYSRISANAKAVAATNKYQETVEKHPELYSAANEWKFQKELQDWQSDPNKIDFNGSYTPYHDSSKKYQPVIDKMMAHPDVRYEIEWYTNPETGETIKRGEREVKELTANKIKQTLKGLMDGKDMSQAMIDYEYKMANTSLEDAQKEIQDDMTLIDNQIAALKDNVNAGIRVDESSDLIDQFEQDRAKYELKYQQVTASGDPSSYYTRDKYIDDNLTAFANGYAFKDRGKLEDDFLFTEEYKFGNAMKLAKFNSDLNVDEAIRKQKAGVGTGSKTTKAGAPVDAEGKPLVANPFEDDIWSIFEKGEGQISSPERMAATYTNSGQVDPQTGTFMINLSNMKVHLDLKPSLNSVGIQESTKRATGYRTLQSAYDKWTTTKEGMQAAGPKVGATGRAGSMTQPRFEKKSVNDFLRSEAGKQVAASIRKDYGLDVANKEDMDKVLKFMESADTQTLTGLLGTMLEEKKISGNVRVKPAGGTNAYVDNEGNLVTNVVVTATHDEFANILGSGTFFGASGVDLLIKKGIINPTLESNAKTDDEGKQLYEMPIITRVTKDLAVANMDYLATKGNTFFPEHMPAYDQSFRQLYDGIQKTKSIEKNPERLAKITTDNVSKILNAVNPPEDKKKAVMDLIKYHEGVLKTGDKAGVIDSRKALSELSTATLAELQELMKGNQAAQTDGVVNVSAPANLRGQINDYMQENYPADQFQKEIPNIKKAFTGPEVAGKKGAEVYTMRNPQSGAYGKYQFLPSTLRGLWESKYKSEYSTASGFIDAFKKTPALQEQVMDEWIMDRAKAVGYNPYKVALAHFLGDEGFRELAAGKKSWESNPTASRGIRNMSPLAYLRSFEENYQ
jgi:hypothetical protein